jgi:hypothetical protein
MKKLDPARFQIRVAARPRGGWIVSVTDLVRRAVLWSRRAGSVREVRRVLDLAARRRARALRTGQLPARPERPATPSPASSGAHCCPQHRSLPEGRR